MQPLCKNLSLRGAIPEERSQAVRADATVLAELPSGGLPIAGGVGVTPHARLFELDAIASRRSSVAGSARHSGAVSWDVDVEGRASDQEG